MQSLFDAEDDDEGMFGGTSEDIFAASPSQSPKKSVEPLSASASETLKPHDSVDGGLGSRPKPTATTAPAPKPSLFSDEEEDLFGGRSAEEKPKREKEEKKDEVTKPRKPVGGVSMFGGIDLFAGKKPSFIEDKDEVNEEPVEAKQGKQFSLK